MKTKIFKVMTIKVVALSLFTAALPAFAHEHDPQALSDLIETVRQEKVEGKVPVVMFDLDDTLINTRERTLRIIDNFVDDVVGDLAQQSQLTGSPYERQDELKDELERLAGLQTNDIQYLLSNTLNNAGIQDPALADALNDFWLSNFFTNEFSARDQENPGAARYVRELVRAGATVVYLTGRDAPRMYDGTVVSLNRNRFPITEPAAVLIMKPDQTMDDLKFKESQYATVAAMGDVVGAFENKPANINSMADAFPQAAAIFLDTIHSPNPVEPQARVQWVENFFHPNSGDTE